MSVARPSRCSRRFHRVGLIDLVGRVDLLTAAAVLGRCALFIGNDTGLDAYRRCVRYADVGPVWAEPERQYAPWGPRAAFVCSTDSPETMFGPGFDHRTTDTLMDGLSVDGRRGGRMPIVGPSRERRGVNRARLSAALVVVHDEERQLADCLACLDFADEIVVVLDRCRDRSREIARGFTDRLIEGAWEREGPRRHAGIDACRGDWILEIDADERVSPRLAAEIRAGRRHLACGVAPRPVDNFIGERLVRWGWGASFGRSAHAALYRKGAKQWGDQRVHPAVSLSGEQGSTLSVADPSLCRPRHLGDAATSRPLFERAGAGSAR